MGNEFDCEAYSQEKAKEVLKAEPLVEWSKGFEKGKNGWLSISLGNKGDDSKCGFISAEILYDKDGNGQLEINNIVVEEEIRGMGVGTKLLESLKEQIKDLNIRGVFGKITSKNMLKLRAKVFGKNNLHFYSSVTGKEIQKTLNEVLEERINEDFPDYINYFVYSNLEEEAK